MTQSAFAQTDSGSAGLPQFDLSFFAPQILWEAVTFLILLYLMAKFIIPKINRLLDQRASTIQNDLDAAARNRQESERLLAEHQRNLDVLHEEAATIMAQARKEIADHHARSMRQLEEDIQRKKQTFRTEIKFAKRRAMQEIRNLSTEAAILAVEKLIEKNVDTNDARHIVEDVIQELDHLKDNT
ncbi:MAG: F0F1 ATP synthase subunit B [Mariprofundaceae bacterium]|nr:F0F1 ATP synthase subunit B [Mariprofundaceae bacterium]